MQIKKPIHSKIFVQQSVENIENDIYQQIRYALDVHNISYQKLADLLEITKSGLFSTIKNKKLTLVNLIKIDEILELGLFNSENTTTGAVELHNCNCLETLHKCLSEAIAVQKSGHTV